MKDQIITNKILNWYDINKRVLPWRKNVSHKKNGIQSNIEFKYYSKMGKGLKSYCSKKV